jgi:hypothetical protein
VGYPLALEGSELIVVAQVEREVAVEARMMATATAVERQAHRPRDFGEHR